MKGLGGVGVRGVGGEYDFKKHRWLVFSLIFLTDSLTSFTQNGTQNEAICF